MLGRLGPPLSERWVCWYEMRRVVVVNGAAKMLGLRFLGTTETNSIEFYLATCLGGVMEGQLGTCSKEESGEYHSHGPRDGVTHWYSVPNETLREPTKNLPPRPIYQVFIQGI